MIKTIIIAALAMTSVAMAKSLNVSQLVDDYFKQQQQGQLSRLHDECRAPGMGCLDVVCNNLGTYGCDDKSEIDDVLKMCRGNFDGECIRVACRAVGTYGCDDRSEVREIARACVGNIGGECVAAICKRLGQYGCDDRSEILEVINKCAGN